MIDTIAKPVVKGKFWIVERDGEKCATIQAIDEDGGFAFVHDEKREIFPTIKLLSKKHNIEFKERQVDDQGLYQLFLFDPNGVKIELK